MAEVDPQDWRDAVLGRRFAALAQLGSNLGEVGTWDRFLSRRTRILVPIDVQALVVPPTGGEPVVPLTGRADDPGPFDAGTPRPTGIHLHWAMPDALLAGSGGQTADEQLTLPALPDRWVVIRTLQPVGARQVQLRGWAVSYTHLTLPTILLV